MGFSKPLAALAPASLVFIPKPCSVQLLKALPQGAVVEVDHHLLAHEWRVPEKGAGADQQEREGDKQGEMRF